MEQTDRGDVPGWVLVVVMAAGIIVALLGVAGPTVSMGLEQLFGATEGF